MMTLSDHQDYSHRPVMLDAVIQSLAIKPNGQYIDATFGRGGHSQSILEQLNENGQLWVFDRDPQAIEVAKAMASKDSRISVFHGFFSSMQSVLRQHDALGKINGIVADLGVSSPQLDDGQRGFAFQHDGPLDMRFDRTVGYSASEWLAKVSLDGLTDVLKIYGQERYAKRIARAIIHSRKHHAITSTGQLADIIANAHPQQGRHHRRHPATKSFMAIRLFINQELEHLLDFLPQCESALATHGRMVILSFHSLEDRLVKRFIQGPGYDPKRMDFQPIYAKKIKKVKAPKHPDNIEVLSNRRSRSAILRVGEKST